MKTALETKKALFFFEEMNVKLAELNNVARKTLSPNLTISQYLVLTKIVRKSENDITSDDIQMNEVASKLKVTPANVTCVVDNLEKKGYVERSFSKEDRRVITLKATEPGMDLLIELRYRLKTNLVEEIGFDFAMDLAKLTEQCLDIY